MSGAVTPNAPHISLSRDLIFNVLLQTGEAGQILFLRSEEFLF